MKRDEEHSAITLIEQMIAIRQRRIDDTVEKLHQHFEVLRAEMANIEQHPGHMTACAVLRNEWRALEYDLDKVEAAGLEIMHLGRALSVLRDAGGPDPADRP